MGQTISTFASHRKDSPTQDPDASMESSPGDSQPLGFLDLAVELRCMIYKNLFAGAEINVTDRSVNLPLLSLVGIRREDAGRYVTHTVGASRGLLRTCKTINAEAVAFISAASSLAVYRHDLRSSPISRVPQPYLPGVRKLEVEINTFIWVPRGNLPALKQVTLFHNILDTNEDINHMLACDNCERWLVTSVTSEIQDWEFKRRQFKHLAEEENFVIEFVAMLQNPDCALLVSLFR